MFRRWYSPSRYSALAGTAAAVALALGLLVAHCCADIRLSFLLLPPAMLAMSELDTSTMKTRQVEAETVRESLGPRFIAQR